MEVSRFSCISFSSVLGVSDYGRFSLSSRLAAKPMWPSHVTYQVGISIYLYEAQYPAHQCPCLRFDGHLAIAAAKLGVRMVRYSFPAGLFHPLRHAGLSRRTNY
jgi:hypothetical protein